MVIVFNKQYKGRELNHSLEQKTKVEASLKLEPFSSSQGFPSQESDGKPC